MDTRCQTLCPTPPPERHTGYDITMIALPTLQLTLKTAFWLACGAVTAGSLTPAEHLPPMAFDLWDKAQHALAFALMALLGLTAYGKVRSWVICTGLLGFGAAIELAQWLSGWRHGDLLDLAADGFGIVAGLVLFVLIRPAKLSPRQQM